MDQIHPTRAKLVKNCINPTHSCVFDTYWLWDAHAAMAVPKPGRNKLRAAQTYATG